MGKRLSNSTKAFYFKTSAVPVTGMMLFRYARAKEQAAVGVHSL
jgi:hypothetical protein